MNESGPQAGDRELAEHYDHAFTADEWGEPEPADKPERLDVTLSVRFSAAEISAIRTRAAEAGLKPTTYIRHCVLTTEQAPVDRARIALQLHPAATSTRRWTVSHLHPDTSAPSWRNWQRSSPCAG